MCWESSVTQTQRIIAKLRCSSNARIRLHEFRKIFTRLGPIMNVGKDEQKRSVK